MTCKNCIHFKVCDQFGVFDEGVGENYEHKTCHDFLSKKLFNTGQFITSEELKKPELKSITYSTLSECDPYHIASSSTTASGGNYTLFNIPTIKEIRTVKHNDTTVFDKEVNKLLNEGYILTNRYLSNQDDFIAEFELYE